jgi:hypothetical protein
MHQGKYTKYILRKLDMNDSKMMETLVSTTIALNGNKDREPVYQKE